jgi:hypothetical protein
MDMATSRHERYEKFIKVFSQATFREETTWKTPKQMEEYYYKESQMHRVGSVGGIDQHNMGQKRDQWWDLVNREINLWFSQRIQNFLLSSVTNSFSRQTLLQRVAFINNEYQIHEMKYDFPNRSALFIYNLYY